MELYGEVVSGKGIGGSVLGFPTANLRTRSPLPPRGVYAARAILEKESYPAVLNVGTHPTLPEGPPTVEVHLMDFSGDLYGKRLRVQLLDFLRPEMRFASLDALRAQIASDAARARIIAQGRP